MRLVSCDQCILSSSSWNWPSVTNDIKAKFSLHFNFSFCLSPQLLWLISLEYSILMFVASLHVYCRGKRSFQEIIISISASIMRIFFHFNSIANYFRILFWWIRFMLAKVDCLCLCVSSIAVSLTSQRIGAGVRIRVHFPCLFIEITSLLNRIIK